MAGAGAALTACGKEDLSTPLVTKSTQTSLPVVATQPPSQAVIADGNADPLKPRMIREK